MLRGLDIFGLFWTCFIHSIFFLFIQIISPSNPTPTTDRETPTTDRERLINKLQCKGFLWVTILKLVVTLEGKNEELYLLSFP
jgi:hypothetical protein